MTMTKPEEGGAVDVDALSAMVTKQGSLVRQLKKDGAKGDALQVEVAKLLELKGQLAAAEASQAEEDTWNGFLFDNVLLQRMFIVPSFEIHNGVKGLFDLGPPGCGLKANIVDLWRKHFVMTESMLEMECTNLTPYSVLETSGHVERFTDLMVKDLVSGEPFRADKLLEDYIDTLLEENPTMDAEKKEEHRRVQRQADAYSPEELDKILRDYGVKSAMGNDLSSPFPFNLMFRTTIGPEGTSVGFLRPETAQGLFVNFRRLLDHNGGRIPFAAAQVGLGFRNEIAPKNGLLRVREFTMAEIEHFVHPENKSHPRFETVADKELVLFGRDDQLGSGKTARVTVRDAVEKGLIANETLAYFMARTQLFLEKIGMDKERMRFRQHLKTEMAHYASDCWDMEIKTSYGWVECVGHADRACYDLQVHSAKTNVSMEASLYLTEPKVVEYHKLNADKKKIGMTFKAEQKKVVEALEGLSEDAIEALDAKLDAEGSAAVGGYTVTREMVAWKKETKTVSEEKFTPSVIEPSFGIGRILYALLEHSFYQRDDDDRKVVMRFLPNVAPFKCGVFPLSANKELFPPLHRLDAVLTEAGISTKLDTTSVSIGRRYARTDEIGLPFALTVDFDTIKDDTVTLRERDSTHQIRLPLEDAVELVDRLVHGKTTWEEVTKVHPIINRTEEGGVQAQNSTEQTTRSCFSRPGEKIDTSDLKFN